MGDPAAWGDRGSVLLAGSTALAAIVIVLIVAGAPLSTDDLWWHLQAGRMYASEGLWPSADWMLHTALPSAPIQHEWLFGVVVHLLDESIGHFGLRIVHVVLAAAVFAAAGAVAWQRGLPTVPTALAVVTFALLAIPRLAQFRPDLVSISMTWLTVMVLRRSGQTPALRLGLVFVAYLAWSNAHSLVLVGINLMLAAFLGHGLAWALARWWVGESGRESAIAGLRWCAALMVVALMGALINPRGVDHLLTFVHSDAYSAMWHIADEWTRFVPFVPISEKANISSAQWLTASMVVAAFAITAGVRVIRLWIERTPDSLDRLDPVGLGLGMAGVVAMLATVRFAWLGLLPLLYVLRLGGPVLDAHRGRRASASVALALVTLLVAIGLIVSPSITETWQRYGHQVQAYLERPIHRHLYFDEGVRFLRASGLVGNLYNAYWMGGYLGYWNARRTMVFVDGRTEHYGFDTYLDYSSVRQLAGAREGESFLHVLDRTEVDIFFGVGFAGWWNEVNTTSHLDRVPGWRLVSRSYRHAIYLREHPAQQANWERVIAYYREQGVPFDARRGLDPDEVVSARPEWAIANGLLPTDYRSALASANEPEHPHSRANRESLALIYALSGAYRHQIAMDEGTLARGVASAAAARRLVYAYLVLDDIPSARRWAGTASNLERHAGARARALVDAYAALPRLEARSDPEWARYRAVRRARLLVPSFPASPGETWPIEHRMCVDPECQ